MKIIRNQFPLVAKSFATFYAIAILMACGGGSYSQISKKSTVAKFVTNQAADSVLGQADFTTSTSNDFFFPWGNPVYVNGKFYANNGQSHNYLCYNQLPEGVSNTVNFYIGDSGGASGTTSTTLNQPYDMSVSNGKTLIADNANMRALLYNSVPTATGASAAIVFGAPNATTSGSGSTTQSEFGNISSVFLSTSKVIIPESGANRVLIWNSIPGSHQALADLVLGQSLFTGSSSGTTAITLHSPWSAWTDETRLVVIDTGNNRVLIWTSFPTSNAQAANIVLGQANFTTGTAASPATSASLSSPKGVCSDGTRLFIADTANNRVLVWNTFPTTNGQAADVVLGQPDFVSSSSGTTANLMNEPLGCSFDGNKLIVTDSSNNRYLVFNAIQ